MRLTNGGLQHNMRFMPKSLASEAKIHTLSTEMCLILISGSNFEKISPDYEG